MIAKLEHNFAENLFQFSRFCAMCRLWLLLMVDIALNPRHPRLYFQPVCLESVCVMVLGILDIPLWMKWICGYLQLSPQHWQRWGRALNVIQPQIQLLLHSISLFCIRVS